jgi:hypothetical protein
LQNPDSFGVDWYKYDVAQNHMDFRFKSELEVFTSLDGFAKRALNRTPNQPRYQLEQPPIVTLVGRNLPSIFEEHFGLRAGRGRTGPFMRFAIKVIGAMKLNYQPNTIQTYLVAAERKRNRRKIRAG